MPKPRVQLGELELEIMNVLWQANQPMTVADVVKALDHSRAYTTVMTTMSRLHEKGYLSQERTGRAFSYTPCISRTSALQQMWGRMADILMGGDMLELIPHLLGSEKRLTEEERELLGRLAEDIKDRDA